MYVPVCYLCDGRSNFSSYKFIFQAYPSYFHSVWDETASVSYKVCLIFLKTSDNFARYWIILFICWFENTSLLNREVGGVSLPPRGFRILKCGMFSRNRRTLKWWGCSSFANFIQDFVKIVRSLTKVTTSSLTGSGWTRQRLCQQLKRLTILLWRSAYQITWCKCSFHMLCLVFIRWPTLHT